MQIIDIKYYPSKNVNIHKQGELLEALRKAKQAGTMENFDWAKYGKDVNVWYTAQAVEDENVSKIPTEGRIHIYTEPGDFEKEYLEPIQELQKSINWDTYYNTPNKNRSNSPV